jgi:hypothetical protein
MGGPEQRDIKDEPSAPSGQRLHHREGWMGEAGVVDIGLGDGDQERQADG